MPLCELVKSKSKMKKIKDNLWNCIFHKKQLKKQREYKKLLHAIIGWFPQICQDLREAKTLEGLMNIHKKAWELGYQNSGLGPCPWGMFRTKDILQMQPSEVYLGDIWGLSTKNIPFWNEHRTETMAGNGFGIDDDKKIYDLIMSQYRNHLRNNFNAIKQEAENWLFVKKAQ